LSSPGLRSMAPITEMSCWRNTCCQQYDRLLEITLSSSRTARRRNVPSIRQIAGDHFIFQQDSAPAQRAINTTDCWRSLYLPAGQCAGATCHQYDRLLEITLSSSRIARRRNVPSIRQIAGDHFIFQQDSAPAQRAINTIDCWRSLYLPA